MILLLCLVIILILYHSSNLLLSLLLLEIFSFLMLYYLSFTVSSFFDSDYLVLVIFSIFVMEGVIALSGLIMLVSFTGSDYISSSSLTRL